jgi:hypothetical protein
MKFHLAWRAIAVAATLVAAVSLWAGEVTRPNVSPKDLVTLQMVAGADEGCGPARVEFRRVFPDGGAASRVFRIPEGRLLVVTDVDWHYHSGAPGLVQILALVIENLRSGRYRIFGTVG